MFVVREGITPRHLSISISVSMHRPPPQKETQSKTCRACNAGQYNGRLFKDERKSAEDILKKYLAVTPWNGAHCLAHAVSILKLCDCVSLWSGAHYIDIVMKGASRILSSFFLHMFLLFTSGAFASTTKRQKQRGHNNRSIVKQRWQEPIQHRLRA